MKLQDIKDPSFLKQMDIKELKELSSQIRTFLLENIAKNGGHLSSNLGVVELTIALHYCFDAPKDKIFFDVGHQSYTHKILTGRANEMSTLRQYGGLSGFQKRSESVYDCFEAGHSSTSLPFALGMAAARDLNRDNYYIVPVIGDGALSSGLSLETLNQIGYQKHKMIIVFNDNNMSISNNVGVLSSSISRLRNSKGYNSLKDNVKSVIKKGKNGEAIIQGIHDIKEKIKEPIVDSGYFSEFGFYYIGPVDGQNIKAMIDAFETAKKKDIPVVVHCITSKGNGYALAETDTIGKWHNVEPFDLKSGKPLSEVPEDEIPYSKLVASYLEDEMAQNKDIVAITPAMAYEARMNRLFSRFPDRCYDVGIAEDLAVDMAGGLSLSGKLPFVFIESSYLQRAYDQLNHDVARMNLPMVVAIDHSSLVPREGETHHGVFDISLLRTLPNVVVCEGKDADEIRDLLYTGLRSNKPFFVRYPSGNLKKGKEDARKNIEIGTWEYMHQVKDPELYILSYGNALDQIARIIEENELPYSLVNTRFIKPIDEAMLKEILEKQKPIYLYTNDMIKGGLGDEILEFANKNHLPVQLEVIGIDDVYVGHGSASQLKESLKIDIHSLFEKIENDKK
ncbi:MAG: 1-deoxy-D-xylulose-5-phosphate synthase [Erysipelotrichaceae bacterium]|nr:1-deoxy-D-xylulose-5-phosphate synthase [Erysipelotrichaceae bacterium]